MRSRSSWLRLFAWLGLIAALWVAGEGAAQEAPPFPSTLLLPVPPKGEDDARAPGTPEVPGAKELPAAPAGKDGDPCAPCAKQDDKKKAEPKDPWVEFWKKVPPVRPTPPLGNFFVPPRGPGYYSLRDLLTGNYREGPPKSPWPSFTLLGTPFFDIDWRFLEDPKNTEHDLFDPLHRIHLGDDWLFNTGGQAWWRHMHEVNSRLSGRTNNYDLFRTRLYGDLWYKDIFRVYVEFIAATSLNQDLPPALIDVNKADLLNAFFDVKLFTRNCKPAYLRVGRQELLFGSQRLITSLEWSNTRRTFQGVRGFRQGDKFDVDLFWVQPVVPNADRFDSVDNNQNFWGLWTTYRPRKGQFFNAYYLGLDNTNRATPLGLTLAPVTVHTLGTRYTGSCKQFLWDLEPMVQFGSRGDADILAAAVAAGSGWNFSKLPWNPTVWAYYDYATGDPTPGAGRHSTFNQLFPFGHWYLGWADYVGRQNIQDVSFHLQAYPAKWLLLWFQYHNFTLAQGTDALYNAGGTPLRRDPTGRAGRDVGDEIDFVASIHLSRHSDILLGWSKLYAGDFIRNTAGAPGSGRSPELFYFMYNFRW